MEMEDLFNDSISFKFLNVPCVIVKTLVFTPLRWDLVVLVSSLNPD